MFEYKGYLGSIEADDGDFAGRVVGLRDVITFAGRTYDELEQAFRESVDDYLDFCSERGEEPEHSFSREIPIHVSPETHRRAAARAESEGIPLDQWIAKRIESAL